MGNQHPTALDVALDRLQEARERERELRAVIAEERRFADAAITELHLALESQNDQARP